MPRKVDRESMKKRLIKKKADEEEANYIRGDTFLRENQEDLLRLGAKHVTDIRETTRLLLEERNKKANKEADKVMKELLEEEKRGKKDKVHLPSFKDGIFLTGNPRSKKNKKKIRNLKEEIKKVRGEAKKTVSKKYNPRIQKVLGDDSFYDELGEGGGRKKRRKKTRKKRKRRRKKTRKKRKRRRKKRKTRRR